MSREQATTKSESASEQTWSLISMDGGWQSITQCLTHSLSSKEQRGISTTPMKCEMQHKLILKNNKYADLARNNNHEFVPLVAESLGGLGNAAVKLFGEIAWSQASSRHPVGHILRRLIDISQIAVQKGNFRRLQKAVSLCSLDDPFSSERVSRDHLAAMGAVGIQNRINDK